jgi:methylated-DNA-protein-cysteine methyltransferase-like protein
LNFFQSVYAVVSGIPRGRVASYGYVARMAGSPRGARQVGWALHRNPDPEHIPCHRVVTKDGKCSTAFVFGGENRQRALLEGEGVGFLPDGKVDMGKYAVGGSP